MFEPDVVALLESGCSLTVGTVDDDGNPCAVRGWGLDIEAPDRIRLRVDDDPPTVANLRSNGRIAVTATVVATLRSIQVKGVVTGVETPTAADRARIEQFTTQFFAAVEETDGTDPAVLSNARPADYVVLEMRPAELYDQTPGPTAGTRLASAETP